MGYDYAPSIFLVGPGFASIVHARVRPRPQVVLVFDTQRLVRDTPRDALSPIIRATHAASGPAGTGTFVP